MMSARANELGQKLLAAAVSQRALGLLLLFVVLRLLLVAITLIQPEGGVLVDSGGYLALRNRLIETGQYANLSGSAQDLNWPPGYPLFLALIRSVTGPGLWPVTLVQLALSGALGLVALRQAEDHVMAGAGVSAAWILALNPNLMVWSLTIMSEVLFAALVLAAAAVLLGWSQTSITRRAVLSGALLAVSAYVRPFGLILLPVWALCLAVILFWETPGRTALKAPLALLLAGSILVAPWFARNRAVHGETVFSTVGAKTLVNFNLAAVIAEAEGVSRNRAAAMIEDGADPFTLFLELLRDHPVPFVTSQAFGVVRTLVGTDIGVWGNVLGWDDWTGLGLLSTFFGSQATTAADRVPADFESALRYGLLLVSLLYSGIFLGLAALGLLRWPRTRSRLVFWLPLVTILVLVVLPGASGQARFRVPAAPFLALYAGVGWLALSSRLPYLNRRNERSNAAMIDQAGSTGQAVGHGA